MEQATAQVAAGLLLDDGSHLEGGVMRISEPEGLPRLRLRLLQQGP